jgi:hypothetical protein
VLLEDVLLAFEPCALARTDADICASADAGAMTTVHASAAHASAIASENLL